MALMNGDAHTIWGGSNIMFCICLEWGSLKKNWVGWTDLERLEGYLAHLFLANGGNRTIPSFKFETSVTDLAF